jgi:hypothetical protein
MKDLYRKAALLACTAVMAGCSKASFEYTGEILMPLGDGFTETFTQNKAQGEVDILIISDNSGSMAAQQIKLGERFTQFTSALNAIDYQIGIITTDVESTNSTSKGALVQLSGQQTRILKSGTPDVETTFLNTVKVGTTGSGNEQPMAATIMAFEKRNAENAGFFRSETDLAILVLSDEDEMSNGAAGTTAAEVVQQFKNIWGNSKRLLSFGIIIKPGDQQCLDQQLADSAGGSFGTRANDLAKLTGGETFSICDSDYSTSLQAIGEKVRNLVFSIQLTQVPVPRSVHVDISTGEQIGFRVEGDRIIFDRAPQQGARIIVTYNMPKTDGPSLPQ